MVCQPISPETQQKSYPQQDLALYRRFYGVFKARLCD
jgi:hypothetical protein